MTGCMQELNDRNIRKYNVLLFNLPETNSVSGISNEDTIFVNKFFNLLSPEIALSIRTLMRLGKDQQMAPRPRLLRVTLTDETCVRKAITAYRDVGILFLVWDKTPMQVKQYRKAREMMEQRLRKGERDLRLIYQRGEPRIVSRPKDPPQSP